MKLSVGGILAFLLATLHGPALATEVFKEVEVSVPAAPPWITIVGPGAPIYKPPRSSGLVIKLQVDQNGKFRKPKDIFQAVQFVRRALPPAYFEELAYANGRERPGFKSDPLKAPPVWKLDLSQFLYKIWDLGDSKTKLGRQFACINWGEFSLQAFYTEVTNELPEARGLEVRRDIPDDYEIYAASSLAHRLLHICSQTK